MHFRHILAGFFAATAISAAHAAPLQGGLEGAEAAHLWDRFHDHRPVPYFRDKIFNMPAHADGPEVTHYPESFYTPHLKMMGDRGGMSHDVAIIVPENRTLMAAPGHWEEIASYNPGDVRQKPHADWNPKSTDEGQPIRQAPQYANANRHMRVVTVNISTLYTELEAGDHTSDEERLEVARTMLAYAYRKGVYTPPAWFTQKELNGLRNADRHIPGLIWMKQTPLIYELWSN